MSEKLWKMKSEFPKTQDDVNMCPTNIPKHKDLQFTNRKRSWKWWMFGVLAWKMTENIITIFADYFSVIDELTDRCSSTSEHHFRATMLEKLTIVSALVRQQQTVVFTLWLQLRESLCNFTEAEIFFEESVTVEDWINELLFCFSFMLSH